MRYSLLNKQGEELPIAIEPAAFTKNITIDPKTGEPTSYEALGYTLGFSEDNARTPHSEDSTKLAQKGVAFAEKRAAMVGQTASSEPQPDAPKAKAMNSATAETETKAPGGKDKAS